MVKDLDSAKGAIGVIILLEESLIKQLLTAVTRLKKSGRFVWMGRYHSNQTGILYFYTGVERWKTLNEYTANIRGSVVVVKHNRYAPTFKDFLRQLEVKQNRQKQEWLTEYWEVMFVITTASRHTSLGRFWVQLDVLQRRSARVYRKRKCQKF